MIGKKESQCIEKGSASVADAAKINSHAVLKCFNRIKIFKWHPTEPNCKFMTLIPFASMNLLELFLMQISFMFLLSY